MSNLTKLEFAAFDISGKNYLSWILDAEIHLNTKDLEETIKENNDASLQDHAKALVFLCHHLHEGLKTEYLTMKDPLLLWNALCERYEHLKTVILPKARYEWMHLSLHDFKTIAKYNSALFKITSQLKLCGEKITDEDMLEKTFSTFHASNELLHQQYRERGFQKYSTLISCLFVAEQNNELLLKNNGSRPIGSLPISETNEISFHGRGHGRGRGRWNRRGRGYGHGHGHVHVHRRGRGRGRGRGCGCGRGHSHGRGRGDQGQNSKDINDYAHQSKHRNDDTACYKCGMIGYWSRTCRTAKNLVELYQTSIKGKEKKAEMNYASQA